MKCQNCGNYDANFHYTSNINGNVTERHLCTGCAEKTGYANAYHDFERNFWPTFGFNMPLFASVLPQMGILENRARQVAAQTVPDIGVTVDETMKKRREINILREEMRKAAEREDFERALELRDQLRGLED